MKYLIVFAVVACAIGYSECISKEIREKMFQQMAKDCGKQEGASDDDINGMLALKPTNTRASKCVQACLAEGPGIIKNKHIDPATVAEITSLVLDDDATKVQQAREVAEACVSVTDDDRCEAVFKIFECAAEFAKSKGYGASLL